MKLLEQGANKALIHVLLFRTNKDDYHGFSFKARILILKYININWTFWELIREENVTKYCLYFKSDDVCFMGYDCDFFIWIL